MVGILVKISEREKACKKAWAKRQYVRCVAEHICIVCKKAPAQVNRKSCVDCLAVARIRIKNYTATHPLYGKAPLTTEKRVKRLEYSRKRKRNPAVRQKWRVENRVRLRAYEKAYLATRPELRKKIALRARAWMKKQPKSRRRSWKAAIDRRRRARKFGATIGTVSMTQAVIDSNGLCGICGEPLIDKNIHLDHIIPLARGGSHEQENVQLAHALCNSTKGAKLPEEYNHVIQASL